MASKKTDKTTTETQDRENIINAAIRSVKQDPDEIRLSKNPTGKSIGTGIMEIDEALGPPLIPMGTEIEFCGDSQTGKTYVALKVIVEAQKQGLNCLFVDAESSFVHDRAIALGVDMDKLDLYGNFNTAEQCGDFIEIMMRKGSYGVIVLDSITSLIPASDYDKSFGDAPKFGAHAMFCGRFTKKMTGLCNKYGTILVLINQFRTAASSMPNKYEDRATGGKGVDYFTHMRLWFTRYGGDSGKVIGDGNEVIGRKSKMVVKKTRFWKPDEEATFDILYGDEKPNPIQQFVFQASNKYNPYIKINRKKYQYIDPFTEKMLVNNGDVKEFIQALLEIDPPENMAPNDTSDSAMDYIMNKLKYSDDKKTELLAAIYSDEEVEIADENVDSETESTE